MDAPEYKQPPLDPTLAALMQQTQQDDVSAIQSRIAGQTNSLTARYGQLTAGDSATLLAHLGSRMAFNPTGTPSGSPLAVR